MPVPLLSPLSVSAMPISDASASGSGDVSAAQPASSASAGHGIGGGRPPAAVPLGVGVGQSQSHTGLDVSRVQIYVRVRPALMDDERADLHAHPPFIRCASESVVEMQSPTRKSAAGAQPQRGAASPPPGLHFAPSGEAEAQCEWTSASFTRVFDTHTTQNQMFDGMEPHRLVAAMREGYSATLMAYGNTGSGKSYTMFGDEKSLGQWNEQRGLVPRYLECIFAHAAQDVGATTTVRLRTLEDYEDRLYDLQWKPDPSKGPMAMHMAQPSITLQAGVAGLEKQVCSVDVSSAQEALSVIAAAAKRRHKSSHAMNETSSRSHMVVFVLLHVAKAGATKSSTLALVDLAGSERQKHTGAAMQVAKEAHSINGSLLSLKGVLKSITLRKPPSFECTLTRLLKPTLLGNTVLALCLNVAPSALHDQDQLTRSTIEFGLLAQKLKPKPQQQQTWHHIQALQNALLQKDDRIQQLEGQSSAHAAEVRALQQKLHDTEVMQAEALHAATRAQKAELERQFKEELLELQAQIDQERDKWRENLAARTQTEAAAAPAGSGPAEQLHAPEDEEYADEWFEPIESLQPGTTNKVPTCGPLEPHAAHDSHQCDVEKAALQEKLSACEAELTKLRQELSARPSSEFRQPSVAKAKARVAAVPGARTPAKVPAGGLPSIGETTSSPSKAPSGNVLPPLQASSPAGASGSLEDRYQAALAACLAMVQRVEAALSLQQGPAVRGLPGADSSRLASDRARPSVMRNSRSSATPLVQLLLAIHANDVSRISELLLAGGQRVHEPMLPSEWTPLLYAAARGTAESVRVLLEFGARVQETDARGNNVFHLLATRGDRELDEQLVRLLIQAAQRDGQAPLEAMLHAVNKDGLTPAALATLMLKDLKQSEATQPQHSSLQRLLDAGVKPSSAAFVWTSAAGGAPTPMDAVAFAKAVASPTAMQLLHSHATATQAATQPGRNIGGSSASVPVGPASGSDHDLSDSDSDTGSGSDSDDDESGGCAQTHYIETKAVMPSAPAVLPPLVRSSSLGPGADLAPLPDLSVDSEDAMTNTIARLPSSLTEAINLCKMDSTNSQRFFALGGLVKALRFMQEHSEHRIVVCQLVEAAVIHDAAREQVRVEDGFGMVHTVMQQQRESEVNIRAACGAMQALCGGNADDRMYLATLTLHTLVTIVSSTSTQQTLCCILDFLATVTLRHAGVGKLFQAEGRPIVERAIALLQKDDASYEEHQSAVRFLGNWCAQYPAAQDTMVQGQGLPAIIQTTMRAAGVRSNGAAAGSGGRDSQQRYLLMVCGEALWNVVAQHPRCCSRLLADPHALHLTQSVLYALGRLIAAKLTVDSPVQRVVSSDLCSRTIYGTGYHGAFPPVPFTSNRVGHPHFWRNPQYRLRSEEADAVLNVVLVDRTPNAGTKLRKNIALFLDCAVFKRTSGSDCTQTLVLTGIECVKGETYWTPDCRTVGSVNLSLRLPSAGEYVVIPCVQTYLPGGFVHEYSLIALSTSPIEFEPLTERLLQYELECTFDAQTNGGHLSVDNASWRTNPQVHFTCDKDDVELVVQVCMDRVPCVDTQAATDYEAAHPRPDGEAWTNEHRDLCPDHPLYRERTCKAGVDLIDQGTLAAHAAPPDPMDRRTLRIGATRFTPYRWVSSVAERNAEALAKCSDASREGPYPTFVTEDGWHKLAGSVIARHGCTTWYSHDGKRDGSKAKAEQGRWVEWRREMRHTGLQSGRIYTLCLSCTNSEYRGSASVFFHSSRGLRFLQVDRIPTAEPPSRDAVMPSPLTCRIGGGAPWQQHRFVGRWDPERCGSHWNNQRCLNPYVMLPAPMLSQAEDIVCELRIRGKSSDGKRVQPSLLVLSADTDALAAVELPSWQAAETSYSVIARSREFWHGASEDEQVTYWSMRVAPRSRPLALVLGSHQEAHSCAFALSLYCKSPPPPGVQLSMRGDQHLPPPERVALHRAFFGSSSCPDALRLPATRTVLEGPPSRLAVPVHPEVPNAATLRAAAAAERVADQSAAAQLHYVKGTLDAQIRKFNDARSVWYSEFERAEACVHILQRDMAAAGVHSNLSSERIAQQMKIQINKKQQKSSANAHLSDNATAGGLPRPAPSSCDKPALTRHWSSLIAGLQR